MENTFLLAQSSGGFFVQIIPLILIFAIFWFLIIRPQQKKIKEHNNMVNNVKKGDHVVTGGGLIGIVTNVSDNEVDIDFGNDVKIKSVKSTLADVRSKDK
ncbi:MAG: preprotein translocase subunit YajC [Pseudomonadota bacterium]|nr:preprotein translocase subunit YajC [Pseudomonadota bacterium]MEC9414453.1 preprotein translocase subunit YajC [Pseudomonadota bacterium]